MLQATIPGESRKNTKGESSLSANEVLTGSDGSVPKFAHEVLCKVVARNRTPEPSIGVLFILGNLMHDPMVGRSVREIYPSDKHLV